MKYVDVVTKSKLKLVGATLFGAGIGAS